MSTIILRTITPMLTALMLIFSVFVLLRGHNEPGGGFIGGLIAASAIAIYGIANGVQPVRRALYFRPLTIAGFGLLLAGLSGVWSVFKSVPFLTGIWWELKLSSTISIDLSTVLFFDIGVYLVVAGTMIGIALSLEERDYD